MPNEAPDLSSLLSEAPSSITSNESQQSLNPVEPSKNEVNDIWKDTIKSHQVKVGHAPLPAGADPKFEGVNGRPTF